VFTVTIIKRACPMCGGDVKGNEQMQYLCKDCMILYRHSELESLYKDLNIMTPQSSEMKIGLFIGRFQPFHSGHLWAIQQIMRECEKVIVGIGSSQYKRTAINPFSADERKEMIETSLKAEGVSCTIFNIDDVNDDSRWVDHVKKIIPHFDIVYTGSPLSKQLFTEKGCFVNTIQRHKNISASEVRVRIQKDMDYDELVPKSVADFLKLIDAKSILEKASS